VRTLLVVPGLFGTEIRDDVDGHLWGTLRCLYRGAPIGGLGGLRGRPGRVLHGIRVLPGVAYDIIGALLKELGRAGYRLDQTLRLFAYDWRLRAVDIGAALAADVRALAKETGGPIDMLGLSNGGTVIRAAFAAASDLPVERVVTSGSPLGGTVETLACLDAGFQFAPLGRTVSPEEFLSCPGALDAIPSPSLAAFLDVGSGGAAAGWDLYDLATWRRLRLAVFRRDADDPTWTAIMDARLRAAREAWRALEAAAAPRQLVCVCGTGLPTQVRVVVRDGRAVLPGEGRVAKLPAAALTTDGDGALSVESSSAWTGATPHVTRIPVSRHRDTVRARPAWDAILEGLKS
jgi:hypothetical protein